MILRRLVARFARAGIPGLLIAIALTGDSRISVTVWLGAAATWTAGVLLWDFQSSMALEPARAVLAWRRRRRPVRRGGGGPRGLREVEALISTAARNPRAHANRLRGRLASLAEHQLPIHHGFEPEDDPARLATLLGDVAWLLDPAVADRSPTVAEISQFLDIILAEDRVVAT